MAQGECINCSSSDLTYETQEINDIETEARLGYQCGTCGTSAYERYSLDYVETFLYDRGKHLPPHEEDKIIESSGT